MYFVAVRGNIYAGGEGNHHRHRACAKFQRKRWGGFTRWSRDRGSIRWPSMLCTIRQSFSTTVQRKQVELRRRIKTSFSSLSSSVAFHDC